MVEQDLHKLVMKIGRKHHARVGVAITTAEGTFTAGHPGTGPAWSTIKVPIAIAASRGEASNDLVDLSIRESDNDASWELWMHVLDKEGDPIQAVDTVLAEGGSKVRWQDPESGWQTAFGYANWPLQEQAKFGAHLECIKGARRVIRDMGKIIEWQRWGLAKESNARVKGGWGLSELDGHYTQRQFGELKFDQGNVGVATITVRYDGFKTGEDAAYHKAQATLDDLSPELVAYLQQSLARGVLSPVDSCPG
ncbi:hypothetical protein CPHO_06480 [Corynebacterium phocae]|uniref:Beta-lactamase n=2 Tax=Corynebacterium phocae TaxID=161895 RepID=A0A1L7D6P3_9CORY|nr:hypothetical protein CPHO_06480 [Corynebacterium phocae]